MYGALHRSQVVTDKRLSHSMSRLDAKVRRDNHSRNTAHLRAAGDLSLTQSWKTETVPDLTMYSNKPTFFGNSIHPAVNLEGVHVCTPTGLWLKDDPSRPWRRSTHNSMATTGGRDEMGTLKDVSMTIKRQPHEVVQR